MPRPRLDSIRTRLTLWYSAVLGALIIGFAVGSFAVLRIVLSRRADRFLLDAVTTFTAEVRKESVTEAALLAVIRDELADYRFREIDFFVFQGNRLIGRSPVEVRDPQADDDAPLNTASLARELRTPGQPDAFTLPDAEGGYRVARAELVVGSTALTIAAVQSWHGYTETLDLIAGGYLIILPLTLLLSALAGSWLTNRSLAPVTAMSRKASSIGRDNLSERLVTTNPHDELGQLAGVFNGMLARLEGSFAQQQRFMQDASHELRSPVTAIRMEAEVSLQQQHRTEIEYRDALSTIRRSSIRLSRIVDDLFFLARHDAEPHSIGEQQVDLSEVVQDAVRGLKAQASARSIGLDFADAAESPVRGDASDLERIVVNVVENAIKYSPAGSTVHITLAPEGDDAYGVRVRDSGTGISPEAQDRIFDRFFRSHTSGGQVADGAGLGLAIARTLAQQYGGRLELESSSSDGSTFLFLAPRSRVA
ncbi:MAG: ATP-binding protein [Gemmatimonadota bacterium]